MATYSSILAWKIPWPEEPGGLQSVGLQRSDTSKQLHFHSIIYYYFFFKGTRTLFICKLCQIFIKYMLHAGQFAGYKVGQDLDLFLKKQRVWQEGKLTCINSYNHRAVFFQGEPSTC